MTIEDIEQSAFVTNGINQGKTPIIKVVGVGGGGGNAVSYMYTQGVDNVRFVVANTDRQALDNSPVPDKVLLGHTGLGAGNKPEVAREAAEESIEAVGAMFDDTTKMAFITAGLGGGTGTGAGPVVARVAREKGILTVGIVTIPFVFEGMKKIKKALEGADEMSKYVDALLLINNERLIEIYADLDFDTAFNKADDTLSNAARSISELITTGDARINLDFNDVDTTLRNGGTAIISCGYGEGDNRVQDAIDDALNSPLLKNSNILGSKRLLFNLYYSRQAERKFMTGEMTAFTSFVSSLEDVDVIYGVAYDDTLGDKVKVTILAAGFDVKNMMPGTPVKPPKHDVEEDEEKQKQKQIDRRVIEEYGGAKVRDFTISQLKTFCVILTPDQMDDTTVLERLEATPTYNRSSEARKAITADAPASAPAPRTSNGGHPTAIEF